MSTARYLTLHSGQAPIAQHKARNKILLAGRRFGKSRLLLAWSIALATNFTGHYDRASPPVVLVAMPTLKAARQIHWQPLMALMENDPRVKKIYKSDFRIEFKGKKPALIVRGANDGGGDNLRGLKLYGYGGDEAQDILPDVWEYVVQPALGDTEGSQALIIGCVNENTLVLPRSGMQTISSLDPGTSPKELKTLGVELWGRDRGFHMADNFWNNGVVPTRVITVKKGFTLESSLPHPILIMGEDGVPTWRRTSELKLGDWVAIDRGMDIWGDKDPSDGFTPSPPKKVGPKRKPLTFSGMSTELAYFLGLWLAEGSVEQGIGRLSITCGDPEIGDYLTSGGAAGLPFKASSGRTDQWRVNSHLFLEYMRYIGMPICKAPHKFLPQWVMNGRKEWAKAFLQGMFDGDGHVRKEGKGVGYSTSSKKLATQLQLLLTNFGIIARIGMSHIPPSEKVKVSSTQYQVTFEGANIQAFRDNIGFRMERKVATLSEYKVYESLSGCIPFQKGIVDDLLCANAWVHDGNSEGRIGVRSRLNGSGEMTYSAVQKCLETFTKPSPERTQLEHTFNLGYFWDEIKSIDASESLTMDFTVPNTHSFWSNGFISHNTPKGRASNFYTFCMEHKSMEEWAYFERVTANNPWFPKKELERLRATMPPKAFRQEFEANWEDFDGQIYSCLNKSVHLLTSMDAVPKTFDVVYMGVDWGDVNPAVTIVGKKGLNYYILDGWCNPDPRVAVEQHVHTEKCVELAEKWGVEFGFADPSQPARILSLRRALGLRKFIAGLNSIKAGNNVVNTLLHMERLFFAPNMADFYDEMSAYHRDTDKLGNLVDEPAPGQKDHRADSLRYVLFSLEKSLIDITKVKMGQPKIWTPNNQLFAGANLPWAN